MSLYGLNERTWLMASGASPFRSLGANVKVSIEAYGTRIIDCGVQAPGGLEAGRMVAEICLAGLGQVAIVPGDQDLWPGPAVTISTDQPIAACMASQYAGWQITGENFFAMGSGPMRAAYGKEKLFDDIGFRERPSRAVGVLETSKLPPEEVCRKIAADCGVEPKALTLVCARTASIAGHVQVVARSVETALHKMHELGFDLNRVQSGYGIAPLPPIAKDDITGIGRTNDAVLYGGFVTLWVRGDDESLVDLGPKIPS
ncbi:MAG TPA: methenyltetrahydromethanopterin cyclohydrolase, partial [Pirellulaceae bacterium]|nr:methenyltetrahydromethanopterin cyclohydrolase [Pirellulaceae bacterium]